MKLRQASPAEFSVRGSPNTAGKNRPVEIAMTIASKILFRNLSTILISTEALCALTIPA
jgi:hypothetical protein